MCIDSLKLERIPWEEEKEFLSLEGTGIRRHVISKWKYEYMEWIILRQKKAGGQDKQRVNQN